MHSIDFARPDRTVGDIAWDGQYLLVSMGDDGIVAVDPSNGNPIKVIVPVGIYAPFSGLAWDGTYILDYGTNGDSGGPG